MKKILVFSSLLLAANIVQSQSSTDKALVERACLDYLEGFYDGDTMKIVRSFKPSLYKLGYWRSEKTGKYESDGSMSFKDAVKYAAGVRAKKNFPKADAPRKVEVLDVMDQIACAKVTAWWGVDYLLLSKTETKWMIEEVLWQGPLKK